MPVTTYTYEGLLFLDSKKTAGLTMTEWLAKNKAELKAITQEADFEVLTVDYFQGESLSYTDPYCHFSISIDTRDLEPIYGYLQLLEPFGFHSALFMAIWTSMSTGETFGEISFIGDYTDELTIETVSILEDELNLEAALDDRLPDDEDYSDEW